VFGRNDFPRSQSRKNAYCATSEVAAAGDVTDGDHYRLRARGHSGGHLEIDLDYANDFRRNSDKRDGSCHSADRDSG
jgi:hypothetical protein